MADALDVELLASAEKTSDGQSDAVDFTLEADETNGPLRQAAKLLLEVTAKSGTGPTLDVEVQTSPSGAGSWTTIASFVQATDVGYQRLCFAPLERYVRVAWQLGGTSPSYTFAVSGNAHVIYAVPDELGLPDAVLSTLTNHKVARKLIATTDRVQNYVASSHEAPLAAWSDAIRHAVVVGTAYELMVEHGFRPEKYDANWRFRYVDIFGDAEKGSRGWLDKVARGELDTPDTTDATPDTFEGGAFVSSDARRGW